MMVVVDDTELARGDAMNLLFRMYDEFLWALPFQCRRMIFGGMADLEGNLRSKRCVRRQGEPMEVVHREVLFIGRLGVIAMGDVEDVVGDIFLNHEPRATTKTHALALTNGMEPKAFVLADATTGFEFNDIAGLLT